jgi:hypothetical protein
MSTTHKFTLRGLAAVLFVAGSVTYAVAQQHPSNHDEPGASCPHECKGDCMMGGGMHGDKSGGMMGGMHGDTQGAGCPMMQMHELADVQIENTKSGAVIRMNAKKAEQVAEIQKLAQRMTQCMSHTEAAPSNTAAPAKHTH